MNLDPITPYNIIQNLKNENAELEEQNKKLIEKIASLEKEVSNDIVGNTSN